MLHRGEHVPLKFTAYDGSSAGPDDAAARTRPAARRAAPPTWRRHPANSAWRAPTSPATSSRTACIPATRTSCSGRCPTSSTSSVRPTRVLANIVRSIGFEHLRADRPAAAGGAAALAAHRRRLAAQQDSRRRGHPSPLRRVEHVLRAGARPVDDLHLRRLPDADATLEEAQENKYRLVFEKLRLQARRPPARRRLRLGRHGALRGPPRRQDHRRHAVRGAGRVGAEGHRRAGPVRPRRGAARRLPRRARVRLRRGVVDRADRAHRRAELPGRTSGS